jgi:hypothetical protein
MGLNIETSVISVIQNHKNLGEPCVLGALGVLVVQTVETLAILAELGVLAVNVNPQAAIETFFPRLA